MKLNEWHKSSCGSAGNCVEVMETEDGFQVRDSGDHGTGPVLKFTHAEWETFLAGVRNDEFDPKDAHPEKTTVVYKDPDPDGLCRICGEPVRWLGNLLGGNCTLIHTKKAPEDGHRAVLAVPDENED